MIERALTGLIITVAFTIGVIFVAYHAEPPMPSCQKLGDMRLLISCRH